MPVTASDREKWDRIYRERPPAGDPEPAEVLAWNAHLLPAGGTALDLAAGLGGNALFLAERGFDTLALDVSGEAIARLGQAAAARNLSLRAEVRDVLAEPLPRSAFDVIAVSRFLERSLAEPLMAALKPGGLLFYQTYAREKASPGGPSNPDFLLAPGELLDLFRPLRLLAYREDGLAGDLARGFRNQALFVGRKP